MAYFQLHQDFFYAALVSEIDECIIWSAGGQQTGGYGQFWYHGRNRRVHVVMCELIHGPKPTPKHHAAHSCNIRICINPRHLSWKTPKENEQDKIAAGTYNHIGERHPMARLTSAQVIDIRARYEFGVLPSVLAKEFGYTTEGIKRIVKRKTWKHLP